MKWRYCLTGLWNGRSNEPIGRCSLFWAHKYSVKLTAVKNTRIPFYLKSLYVWSFWNPNYIDEVCLHTLAGEGTHWCWTRWVNWATPRSPFPCSLLCSVLEHRTPECYFVFVFFTNSTSYFSLFGVIELCGKWLSPSIMASSLYVMLVSLLLCKRFYTLRPAL